MPVLGNLVLKGDGLGSAASGMTAVVSRAPGEREISWVVPVSSPFQTTVLALQKRDLVEWKPSLNGNHRAMDQLWMLGKSSPSGSGLHLLRKRREAGFSGALQTSGRF